MKRLALLVLTAVLLVTASVAWAGYIPGKSKASGDVNGDGRTDRITFKGKQGKNGKLTVKLAKGKTISTTKDLKFLLSPEPGIVTVRDGKITVMRDHISTCNTYVVFAVKKGQLKKVDRYCTKFAKGEE